MLKCLPCLFAYTNTYAYTHVHTYEHTRRDSHTHKHTHIRARARDKYAIYLNQAERTAIVVERKVLNKTSVFKVVMIST